MLDRYCDRRTAPAFGFVVVCLCGGVAPVFAQDDPWPSWSDGAAKRLIIDYVNRVTTSGGANFVPNGWLTFAISPAAPTASPHHRL